MRDIFEGPRREPLNLEMCKALVHESFPFQILRPAMYVIVVMDTRDESIPFRKRLEISIESFLASRSKAGPMSLSLGVSYLMGQHVYGSTLYDAAEKYHYIEDAPHCIFGLYSLASVAQTD